MSYRSILPALGLGFLLVVSAWGSTTTSPAMTGIAAAGAVVSGGRVGHRRRGHAGFRGTAGAART